MFTKVASLIMPSTKKQDNEDTDLEDDNQEFDTSRIRSAKESDDEMIEEETRKKKKSKRGDNNEKEKKEEEQEQDKESNNDEGDDDDDDNDMEQDKEENEDKTKSDKKKASKRRAINPRKRTRESNKEENEDGNGDDENGDNSPPKKKQKKAKIETKTKTKTKNKKKQKKDDVYLVDNILGWRYIKGECLYHVKWSGYGPESNTWEPLQNVAGNDKLQNFVTKIQMELHNEDEANLIPRIMEFEQKKLKEHFLEKYWHGDEYDKLALQRVFKMTPKQDPQLRPE